MPDNFFLNLDALTEKVTEVAVQIDAWTRNGNLKTSFPDTWRGMTRFQAVSSLLHEAAERRAAKRQ